MFDTACISRLFAENTGHGGLPVSPRSDQCVRAQGHIHRATITACHCKFPWDGFWRFYVPVKANINYRSLLSFRELKR
jgi:hypothetical protein